MKKLILLLFFIPVFVWGQIVTSDGKITNYLNSIPDYTDGFLPDTIPVAVGVTIKLYNDNVFYAPKGRYNNFTYIWTCDKGTSDDYGWTYTGDIAGNYNLSVLCKVGTINIETINTVICVKENKTFTNDTILAIGNSITSQGWDTQMDTILNKLIGTLVTIGTQTTGAYYDEGRSGWSFSTFLGATSPFYYSSNIDISQYLTDNSYTEPEFIRISLGVNDCVSSITMDDVIANSDTLIDSLLFHTINSLIIISLPTSCENTGAGWISNYARIDNYERYILRIREFRKRLYNKYGEKQYDDRVVVDYSGLEIDRNDGYPKTLGNHNNGVHPTTKGHGEISKALYNTMNHYK